MVYCSDRKRKMKHHSEGQSDLSGSLNMSAETEDHVKEKKHLSSSSEDVLQVQGVDNSSSRIAELISPSFFLLFWWALFYTFYICIWYIFCCDFCLFFMLQLRQLQSEIDMLDDQKRELEVGFIFLVQSEYEKLIPILLMNSSITAQM